MNHFHTHQYLFGIANSSIVVVIGEHRQGLIGEDLQENRHQYKMRMDEPIISGRRIDQ